MPYSVRIKILLLLASSASPLLGCSAFQRDGSLADYDQTRRRINGEQLHSRGAAQIAELEEEKKELTWEDFTFESAAKNLKKSAGYGPNRDIAKRLYLEADGLFREASQAKDSQREKKFLAAAEKFEKVAGRWPDSSLEEDALFMAGESFFFVDRYPVAEASYDVLIKKYPNTRHLERLETRRFAIARYWLDLSRTKPQSFWTLNYTDKSRPRHNTGGRALKVFDLMRNEDPTGELADDATLAAGNAYFVKKRYRKADDYYTDLRKIFPSSEHQFQAHIIGVKAKLESYRGPDYSPTPLEDAEKLLKKIKKQFPQEAEANRELLARAQAEVRYKKAEQDWTKGKYHDSRHEYQAARFYYDLVARDFSDTPFNARAQERLAEIQGKPANPPQRMVWLTKVFPESSDDILPSLSQQQELVAEKSKGVLGWMANAINSASNRR